MIKDFSEGDIKGDLANDSGNSMCELEVRNEHREFRMFEEQSSSVVVGE